jgi:hypothetical protein
VRQADWGGVTGEGREMTTYTGGREGWTVVLPDGTFNDGLGCGTGCWEPEGAHVSSRAQAYRIAKRLGGTVCLLLSTAAWDALHGFADAEPCSMAAAEAVYALLSGCAARAT